MTLFRSGSCGGVRGNRISCITLISLISVQLGCAQFGRWEPFRTMQRDALHFRQEGNNIRSWMNNNGVLGWTAVFPDENIYSIVGLEYPIREKLTDDHLNGAGPWIGAIVRKPGGGLKTASVTFGYSQYNDPLLTFVTSDFLGYHEDGDSVWSTSINEQNQPNRRGYDDDGDGLIDEDELDGLDNDGDWIALRDDLNNNGQPDHGEPNVDEDYGAISGSDYGVAYRDSFAEPSVPGHIPMNVKIWQKSYAWKTQVKEPIFFLDYTFINTGLYTLDSVFLGFLVDPEVGPFDTCYAPADDCSLFHQYSGYLPTFRTFFVNNIRDAPATPFGVTLLGASRPLADLRFTYRWYQIFEQSPGARERRYDEMASGVIDAEGDPFLRSNAVVLVAVGPFPSMSQGDSLKLALAVVAGQTIDQGNGSIVDHAIRARQIYDRGYRLDNVPASPALRVIPGDNRVTLDWTWSPGDKFPDPLETWDDSNKFVSALPDTHWRRRDPPPGKTKGGRIFEGFKVWRSEYPAFEERQFTVLKQFDVADDLGFNGQTGLQFTHTDSMVTRGRRYWYAVTSFSIPDYFVTTKRDTIGGRTFVDTIITQPVESLIHENAVPYQVPFTPSYRLGQVKVVPNPYRTDRNYTYEGRGWEGLARQWDETKRLIWFIHLPPRCTIRIFTLTGDLVSTIEHYDDVGAANNLPIAQEEWHLLSDSNRAIASGVYVFLVESEYGNQIGKFVVIR